MGSENLPAVISSDALPIVSPKLKTRIGGPLTLAFVSAQLARFRVLYGVAKDRTDEQQLALAKEWFELLKGFGELTVVHGFNEAIKGHKFQSWPPPGVVFEFCREHNASWRSIYPALPPPREPPEPPPTAEELARRDAFMAEMRRQHPSVFAPAQPAREKAQPCLTDTREAPAHVSEAVEAWARKNGTWTGPADPDWRVKEAELERREAERARDRAEGGDE